MEYSFPHYLLSKQTVDDRALNKDVLTTLQANLSQQPIRITEVGAGIGTMLRRLVRWNILQKGEYVLVDDLPENMDFARQWIHEWAGEEGLNVTRDEDQSQLLFDAARSIRVRFVLADVFDYIRRNNVSADLLIAHAFLDLLPMPASLHALLSLTGNLAWLTINFDGMTTLEPVLDPVLDAHIERIYHNTMDSRPTGGDSRAGRHLFGHLRQAGAEIIAAGASDWVVHSTAGAYPAQEAYFLHFILHFFESSLTGHAEIEPGALAHWLNERHAQVERGELTYIAHQLDFLVKHPAPRSV